MHFSVSFTGLVATLLAGSQLAAAHMEMSFPPPFRSKFNPHASNIDYSMTAPLSNSGSDFPCKGYHSDLGTAAGAPTASFAPGGTYNFTITGGAAHGGGSCQASLSYDGGKTFTVVESIIGGCPLSANFDFTVPSDAQTGEAIFAWTWFNQIGNREMYMNCAPVTIGGGSAKREIKERAAAFTGRPSIFVANVGDGCATLESSAVVFPNPGPDVKDNGGPQQAPTGSCGAGAAPGGGSGGTPGGGSGSPGGGSGSPGGGAPGGGSGTKPTSSAAAPTVPATSAPAPAPPTVQPPKPTIVPPSKPSSAPGGVFLTLSSASAAVPTTLQTATKTAPASPPASAAPAPAPGAGSGSGPSAGTMSGPCSNEGAWNCIDGKSFQRCASGQWSSVIPMASGTSCTIGTSDTLGRGRRSVRRRSA